MTFVPIESFFVGEIPKPTPGRYEDKTGALDTSIAAATLTCEISVNGAAHESISCSNPGDGTFTIDWPTGATKFDAVGTLKFQVWATEGSNVWAIGDIISIPIVAPIKA